MANIITRITLTATAAAILAGCATHAKHDIVYCDADDLNINNVAINYIKKGDDVLPMATVAMNRLPHHCDNTDVVYVGEASTFGLWVTKNNAPQISQVIDEAVANIRADGWQFIGTILPR